MALTVFSWLALSADAPGGVQQKDWVGPGLLGLGVILGLVLLTVLLWRNMNKQLRRVREHYAEPEDGSDGQDGGQLYDGDRPQHDGDRPQHDGDRPQHDGDRTAH